jgi:hypothetical protein
VTKTASFYFPNLEFADTTRVNCQLEVHSGPVFFFASSLKEALFGVSVAAEKEAEQPGQGLRPDPPLATSTCLTPPKPTTHPLPSLYRFLVLIQFHSIDSFLRPAPARV